MAYHTAIVREGETIIIMFQKVKHILLFFIVHMQIYASEVNFWDFSSCQELVLMCDQRLYPPRFILEIWGEAATQSSVTEVDFEGFNENLTVEIPLILPTPGIDSTTALL